MHRFSINCKVDSVCNELSTSSGRAEAIRIFRRLGVQKVWLETYRNRNFVPASLLAEIKADLVSNGFETGAVIVPTRMSERPSSGWDSVTCFTDPAASAKMAEVVTRSATLFDSLLFDDFLFTDCRCPECEVRRGTRSLADFRSELLAGVIRESIVKPARKVNPEVRLIVKYPCWYEGYHEKGYSLTADNEPFDAIWAGNETRTPDIPQSKAYWIQRWLGNIGKCEGGWFDPLSCPPEIYVEQARNTILGGARESLLHCYDYLYLSSKAFAQDGGSLKVVNDGGCAEALERELPGLRRLAELVEGLEPYGVKTLKRPDIDQGPDAGLQPWFNMGGIPLTAETRTGTPASTLFTAHAAAFGNLREYMGTLKAEKLPFFLTKNAAEALGVSEESHILPAFGSGPDFLKLPELDSIRNRLIHPFGIEFHAPPNVSLLLFRNKKRCLAVIQNFNDTETVVELKASGIRKKYLALPEENRAEMLPDGKIRLDKRSLIVIGEGI